MMALYASQNVSRRRDKHPFVSIVGYSLCRSPLSPLLSSPLKERKTLYLNTDSFTTLNKRFRPGGVCELK